MDKKKKKHGWGMTGKVFTISTIMIMIFFVIVMAFQFLISGYEVIRKTEESISSKLAKAAEMVEGVDFSNPYDYETRLLLADLRRNLSDENALCEFVVTDIDGNIVCALRNEIAIYTYRDVSIKYANFDNVPFTELYQAIEALQKQVDASAVRPEVFFRGEWDRDSYIGETYYAYDCYKMMCGDTVYLDHVQQEQEKNPDTTYMELSGKFYNEFVTGAVVNPQYTARVNENREALIEAVTSDEMEESGGLLESVYYRSFHINDNYKMVMRIQVNPLEAVFANSWNVYAALAIVALAFSTWFAVLFSKMIVKPVKKIDAKAKKLAVLDFSRSHDYDYNSNDELGSLYQSINTLAVNLDKAITELETRNKQLSKDIALEREMDMKRREFTAATSHELKTPLARIRGYAEALQLNLSEEKKNKYCTSLIGEVDLMNGLILEMLSLSKLEMQQYEDLNLETIDMPALTQQITERFQKQIQDKQLTLKTVCLQKQVLATGDAEKIERVITNFMDNAVHYTPEGMGIEIFIEAQENRVRFEIENEGSHVDEDNLPHIWDSFYKEDKARTKEKKSVTAERTGLGLSIVRAILQLHKSDFGVKNTKKGVKFYFYLDKA